MYFQWTAHAVLSTAPAKNAPWKLISQVAADKLGTNAQKLFECMLSREKLGTTGIGAGIAIPHGRTLDSQQAIGVLLQCSEPIEFDAVDKRPVDLLFALLVPDEQCKVHLKTLSIIAEKLNDKKLCRQLRSADSDQALYNIITQ